MCAKKRKHIFIHPDRIEDLDETNRRLEANRKKEEPTGYKSVCHIRNTRRRREILLKSDFVKEKCKSGVFILFKVVNRKQIMLQPVPIEFMNRTSIIHIRKRNFSRFRKYGYKARLDRSPEPASVFYETGLDPMLQGYTYELEEYKVQDAAFGEICAYKLIPLKMA